MKITLDMPDELLNSLLSYADTSKHSIEETILAAISSRISIGSYLDDDTIEPPLFERYGEPEIEKAVKRMLDYKPQYMNHCRAVSQIYQAVYGNGWYHLDSIVRQRIQSDFESAVVQNLCSLAKNDNSVAAWQPFRASFHTVPMYIFSKI